MRSIRFFRNSILDLFPLREEIKGVIVVIIFVSSGMFVSGCMMVRGGNLHPPDAWPPASDLERKTINLTVTAKVSDGSQTNPKILQLMEGQSQKAFMESGLFIQVNLSNEPAKLHADVQYLEDGNMSLARASGFISGLTLGMIPGYVKETVITVTTFKDQAGKELGSIRQSETVSMWLQLFLIFAMPFREEPQSIVRSVFYDLNRATLEQAHMQGIL